MMVKMDKVKVCMQDFFSSDGKVKEVEKLFLIFCLLYFFPSDRNDLHPFGSRIVSGVFFWSSSTPSKKRRKMLKNIINMSA